MTRPSADLHPIGLIVTDDLRRSRTARLHSYILLLANQFPGFANGHPEPIDARSGRPAAQSRVAILLRLFLAIPAILLAYVFRIVNNVVAFLAWFYCLFTGRMNEGMRNISAWLFRCDVQTFGYIFLLTAVYPSLAGGPSVESISAGSLVHFGTK